MPSHDNQAVTNPQPSVNEPLTRLLIGMADAYTGLDLSTFRVTADFALNGIPPGENLASRFKLISPGIWQWQLEKPLVGLTKSTLTVWVKDRQGNINRVERQFSTRQ